MPVSPVMRLSAFGAVMELTCPDPPTHSAVIAALPAYWQPAEGAEPDVRFTAEPSGRTAGGDVRWRVLEDGTVRGEGVTGAQAAHILALRMDYQLGAFARDCAFIHAGVVLHEGRAILLPGASRAGKSTLTAAMVRAGATYVSDDVAAIGLDGRVRLLSRALTLRADMAEKHALPGAGGTAVLHEGTVPVGAVLSLVYRDGAPPLTLRPLSAGEAVLRLVAQAMNGRHQPEAVLQSCAAAVTSAWCAKGNRGEADAASREILDYLSEA
ncbi:hypothetical protein [Ancylobacter sp. IITR112]|uniref:hypothetical protein n=1 Tax=Ancylobacter sp. IITR112 TaxID=3138073 RepID=UPI00352A80EB